jgi:hypothetical protein
MAFWLPVSPTAVQAMGNKPVWDSAKGPFGHPVASAGAMDEVVFF